MIATDVASRGIDVCDITHVFNVDFPRNIEEYVHRVGRTGRAGKNGTSITLMERRDGRHAKELIKILREAGQEVPEQLSEMVQRHAAWMMDRERRDNRGGGYRNQQGGGGRNDGGCFRCGEVGHISKDCFKA